MGIKKPNEDVYENIVISQEQARAFAWELYNSEEFWDSTSKCPDNISESDFNENE